MNYYEATAGPRPDFPALAGEVRADVCVIGAGFTGLSAALELARRGYRVVMLEAARVGSGASGRNGGQVGSGHRRGMLELEARLGREHALALWEMAEEGRRLVHQRIHRPGVNCDWRPGVLAGITRESLVAEYEAEARHLADSYGYAELEMLDRGEMRRTVASADYVAGCLDHGGGHIHPLRLALALAREAAGLGVQVFEASAASSVRWSSPCIVSSSGGTVRADHVLLCGNAYLGDTLEPALAGRVLPVHASVIATAPLGRARAQEIIRGTPCVYSTRHRVDYFRFTPDWRLLFGGGEYYGRDAPRAPAGVVRKAMLRVFPQLVDVAVDYAWSGKVGITLDRIPDFGRVGGNGFYAHGFSGHGVVLSQLAGQLLAEAVSGSVERFDLFARIPQRAFPGGDWLRHPLMAAGLLWYALRDRL